MLDSNLTNRKVVKIQLALISKSSNLSSETWSCIGRSAFILWINSRYRSALFNLDRFKWLPIKVWQEQIHAGFFLNFLIYSPLMILRFTSCSTSFSNCWHFCTFMCFTSQKSHEINLRAWINFQVKELKKMRKY